MKPGVPGLVNSVPGPVSRKRGRPKSTGPRTSKRASKTKSRTRSVSVGKIASVEGAATAAVTTDDQTMAIAKKFKFAVWEHISECIGDRCNLFTTCGYKGGGKDTKCGVERYYLNVVMAPYAEIVDKIKDPFVGHWVGLHLIPLYHHLVKLKKMERGLLTIDLEEGLHAKRVRIHPVYKEIRDTIVAIRREWNLSGLYKLAQEQGYLGSGVPILDGDETEMEGDRSYHDLLYRED